MLPRYAMDQNHSGNFKESHIRIIPTKFGQNPASSLGGDSFEAVVDDGRRTTDDGQPTITIAHHEPLGQVS